MTHELKQIVQSYKEAKAKGVATVLATVVALEGSSYRRPGVRMLLLENGDSMGAVSGGCVEKEVFRQADSVFKTKISKVMTYDGRYRLGCEGLLYILLEVFAPSDSFLEAFQNTIANRESFFIYSYFKKEHSQNKAYCSVFHFNSGPQDLQSNDSPNKNLSVFKQEMQPCSKLILIGAEHDAVQLCAFASLMGWEVTIVANPKEEKSISDFPGASTFINAEPETVQLVIDSQTAIVLMTHSYAKDLQYLIALKEAKPNYFGLLGPLRRREKLFNELLEREEGVSEEFLDCIHGPAGLDIGSETPQEIAIAVMSEILAVTNNRNPIPLKDRVGKIHL